MEQITTSEYHFQLLRIIQFLKLKYIQFVLSKLSISMIKTMIQTKLSLEACSFSQFMHATWCMEEMLFWYTYTKI